MGMQIWKGFKKLGSDSLNYVFNMDFQQKTLPKSLKNCKMKNQKPLSEHQKRSLSNAITALNNAVISTLVV